MVRWCVTWMLIGMVAAAVTACVVQTRLNGRVESALHRVEELDRALAPDAETRSAVQELEASYEALRQRILIINGLKQNQPDLETVGRTVVEVADQLPGIRLERVDWDHGEMGVTIRAETVEALARCGEAFAQHGLFAGTRILRWEGEQEGDRFVIVSSWRQEHPAASLEDATLMVDSILLARGDR